MKQILLNNKLLQILRKIPSKTQKQFSAFLKGLYATKRIQLRLFEYLMEDAPNFAKEAHLKMDNTYQVVFQKPLVQPKDRKNLLNACSDLTKWLEDFLLFKQLEKKSPQRDLLLYSIYKELGLAKNYEHNLKKRHTELLATPDSEPIALLQYNESLYFESTKEPSAISSQYLVDGLKYLDDFYIHKKLKYSSELASRERILNESATQPLTKKTLLQLPDTVLTNTPLNKIYWLHFQLHTVRDSTLKEKIYTTLRDLVYHYPISNKLLHFNSLIYAANYAIQRVQAGDQHFETEALNLYEYGMEQQLLMQNGVFPVFPFFNIVKIYCRQQQFTEAKLFVETYTKKLPTAFRQDNYNLAKVQLYVAQKKYQKANKLLNRIQFRHSQFAIEAALLSIICKVELEELAGYHSAVKQLQVLIDSTTTLTESTINAINYFLEITLALLTKAVAKADLMRKIKQTPTLLHKAWFLEKMNIGVDVG